MENTDHSKIDYASTILFAFAVINLLNIFYLLWR